MPTSSRTLLAALLTAAVFAGVAPTSTAEAGSSTNALVRVEVIDNDAGTRTRSSTAVQWSQTAALEVELAGHAHALAITPHLGASGYTLDFEHSRDGVVVSDDLHLAPSRRFVIENPQTTVVVTVVSIKTSVQSG